MCDTYLYQTVKNYFKCNNMASFTITSNLFSMLRIFAIFYFLSCLKFLISSLFILLSKYCGDVKPSIDVTWSPKKVLAFRINDSQEQNEYIFFLFCRSHLIYLCLLICGIRTGRNQWEKSRLVYIWPALSTISYINHYSLDFFFLIFFFFFFFFSLGKSLFQDYFFLIYLRSKPYLKKKKKKKKKYN